MRSTCWHKQSQFNWRRTDELKLSCFSTNYNNNQSITKAKHFNLRRLVCFDSTLKMLDYDRQSRLWTTKFFDSVFFCSQCVTILARSSYAFLFQNNRTNWKAWKIRRLIWLQRANTRSTHLLKEFGFSQGQRRNPSISWYSQPYTVKRLFAIVACDWNVVGCKVLVLLE